ncbi:MAG: formyltransferase family protein [Alphaproteobacteria bacterium]|jgi:methionyl-tRNA formyltransferase|nr:formyltransferase family protein [Alphaproteobacteria bacterium]MDP7190348.1 formyltransferase family protein [Alphaproteobacteria bacterium]HJO88895.1 formyltransferase family protein [Alphaproteobacteria bacterium]|tara:strand:- start:79 stop:693 length:615 start_codon:yes stop_codon:yes gene_type:complete
MTNSSIVVLNASINPVKRILFLGYDREQTKLIGALVDANCEVHHTDEKIDVVDYDLIISFGYLHILKGDFLNSVLCPVINLHISYLPYNKGAHPNFWSFYDNTPSGVTIHLIDEGIDTGAIIYQKYVNFDNGERTFSQTYKRLINEIERLFLDNLGNIIRNNWVARPQRGEGALHFVNDLPNEFSGWDSVIEEELNRLDKVLGK